MQLNSSRWKLWKNVTNFKRFCLQEAWKFRWSLNKWKRRETEREKKVWYLSLINMYSYMVLVRIQTRADWLMRLLYWWMSPDRMTRGNRRAHSGGGEGTVMVAAEGVWFCTLITLQGWYIAVKVRWLSNWYWKNASCRFKGETSRGGATERQGVAAPLHVFLYWHPTLLFLFAPLPKSSAPLPPPI